MHEIVMVPKKGPKTFDNQHQRLRALAVRRSTRAGRSGGTSYVRCCRRTAAKRIRRALSKSGEDCDVVVRHAVPVGSASSEAAAPAARLAAACAAAKSTHAGSG